MTARRKSLSALAPRLAAAALALAFLDVGAAAVEPGEQARVASQEAAADPFSALVGKRRDRASREAKASKIERFVVSSDGRVFLFSNKGGEGRIKFLCRDNDPRLDCKIDPEGPAEEIVAISGAKGPRGDMIFKNDEGDLILRVGSYGGATVFWPGDRLGQAASKSYGDDDTLELQPAGRGAAIRRAQSAAAHLSAITGEAILFDIGPRPPRPAVIARSAEIAPAADSLSISFARSAVEPAAPLPSMREADEEAYSAPAEATRADSAVLADAVARVAAGMMEVADDPTGARYLGARIKSVKFIEGRPPSLAVEGSALKVVYDPLGDIAGRPSSSAVAKFLEESL
ncbi:MAG: DUF4908 domain-containing protein [Parvularculaceae bacterium]